MAGECLPDGFAREIVAKMLPAEVPRAEGFDLYCLYRPTESVGGDFFDYFRPSEADPSSSDRRLLGVRLEPQNRTTPPK